MDLIVEEHRDEDVVGLRTTQTFRHTAALGPRQEVRGVLHCDVEQATGTLPDGARQVVNGILSQGETRKECLQINVIRVNGMREFTKKI